MIKLDKSAGKCNCQLRVFVLPAYNTVRKLYFYKLISFSVLTLPVNAKIFDSHKSNIGTLPSAGICRFSITQLVD